MNKNKCGVDVSKEWLDARVEPVGAVGRFPNNAAGIAELAALCRAHDVELVIMEASGGYERLPFLLLWEAGIACAIANARSVRTVARLMAEVPEIGTLSNKAVAKLVGLAPIANDSGKRSGRRPVRGGRAGPRSILFVIARLVAKYDPHLAAFHQRLQAAGKEKMVIRIALARKLLVILNAKARDARIEFANAT